MVSALVLAFVLTAAMTPLVIRVSRAQGFFVQPTADRWHLRPVPSVGGVAMALALLAALTLSGLSASMAPVLGACAVMFVMGLVDDVRPLGPATKLMCQMVAAAVLLWFLPGVHITGHHAADVFLGFVWVLGISNAFNLLDNMDGLAAGVAAVAAASLLAVLAVAGMPVDAPLVVALAAFIGVMAGFLVFNFPPASVFMGDSGSHLIGCFLAGTTLMATTTIAPVAMPVAVVLVLTLLVPLFDTVFVTVARAAAGRSVFMGGRDHVSHRLAAWGLGDRGVAVTFQGLGVVGGVAALGVLVLPGGPAWVITVACVCLFVLVGFSLRRVTVDGSATASGSATLDPSDVMRQRVCAVALDVVLLAAAYFLAFAIRFTDARLDPFVPYFVQSVPLVVGVQVVALWLAGKYRRVWGAVDMSEAFALARGSLFGVGASVVALLYVSRFEGHSRSVFLLDAVLATTLVVGARIAVGAADEYFQVRRTRGRAALIYGAGHGGGLAARELQQNVSIGLTPVGFLDDDPARRGGRVDGLPIVAGLDGLEAYLDRHPNHVAAVVVAASRVPEERLERLGAIAAARGLTIRRFRFHLEELPGRHGRRGVVRFPGA